jgi:hypothetical protein
MMTDMILSGWIFVIRALQNLSERHSCIALSDHTSLLLVACHLVLNASILALNRQSTKQYWPLSTVTCCHDYYFSCLYCSLCLILSLQCLSVIRSDQNTDRNKTQTRTKHRSQQIQIRTKHRSEQNTDQNRTQIRTEQNSTERNRWDVSISSWLLTLVSLLSCE